MSLSSLHPYGKAIAAAVTGALSAVVAHYTSLPAWAVIFLGLASTLITTYFAANTPADPDPGRDPVAATDPYAQPTTGSGTADPTATWIAPLATTASTARWGTPTSG